MVNNGPLAVTEENDGHRPLEADRGESCLQRLPFTGTKFHYPFIGSEYWTCKAIRSPGMRFPPFVLASGVQ